MIRRILLSDGNDTQVRIQTQAETAHVIRVDPYRVILVWDCTT